MSPAHEPFAELAPAYALGALDGDDLARFQAHLARGCGECERALAEYREALAGAAADLREAPPGRVKEALVARVAPRRAAGGPAPGLRAALRWVGSLAVAAALVAALVATYVSGRYEARLGEMAREVAALHQEIAHQRQALSLLRDPATRVVSLAGQAPSPQAQGRMIWNDREGGVFVAADLPRVPPGKAYELWVIAGARPIPAGLFKVDTAGNGSARVAPLVGAPPVVQFAVTLEPEEGVPAPTGPLYLASK